MQGQLTFLYVIKLKHFTSFQDQKTIEKRSNVSFVNLFTIVQELRWIVARSTWDQRQINQEKQKPGPSTILREKTFAGLQAALASRPKEPHLM